MSNIVFTSFFKDGTVSVNINGKRYVYITDPAYHERWQSTARYKPGKVLNDIKRQVNMGAAKLIEKPSPLPPNHPIVRKPALQIPLDFKDWLEF